MGNLVTFFESSVSYFQYSESGIAFFHSTSEDLSAKGKLDEGQVFGYIRNGGSEPLFIRTFWGKTVEIKPNEMIPYCRAELDRFPDAEPAPSAEPNSPEEIFYAAKNPFLQ